MCKSYRRLYHHIIIYIYISNLLWSFSEVDYFELRYMKTTDLNFRHDTKTRQTLTKWSRNKTGPFFRVTLGHQCHSRSKNYWIRGYEYLWYWYYPQPEINREGSHIHRLLTPDKLISSSQSCKQRHEWTHRPQDTQSKFPISREMISLVWVGFQIGVGLDTLCLFNCEWHGVERKISHSSFLMAAR